MVPTAEQKERLPLNQAATFICPDCGETAKAFSRLLSEADGRPVFDPPVVCDACGVMMVIVDFLNPAVELSPIVNVQ